MRISGFSKNGSDLFKIAVRMAGFDAQELLLEIHRRAPAKATEATVTAAMHEIRQRHIVKESACDK